MIIKELSCERFAGVQDSSINLETGMNILLGANESGKSTMADLLYQLFFQDTKLDGRKDKIFLDAYFPKGIETDGDSIDGTVRFETEKGTYKLYKEWSGGTGVCKLVLPEGTRISKREDIKKILSEELQYGKGIFDEVIFSTQKRQQTLLTGLLDSQKGESPVLQDLSATVNRAVMETGGISVDKLEMKLTEKLDSYANRWDFAAGMPEGGKRRGIQNPWKNSGSILSAYYAMEAAAEKQRETESLEKAIEATHQKIREWKRQKLEAEEARDRFTAYQGILSNRENLKKLKQNAEKRIAEMETAADRWPAAEEKKAKASQLKHQLEQARIYELYEAVTQLQNQLQEQRNALTAIGQIDPEDIQKVQFSTSEISRLEATIHGLNLAAKLKCLGDTPISVVSAVTNQPIDISEGCFSITEAVEITVPGILQLQLMPQGVDLDRIQKELEENRNCLNVIFRKYRVGSLPQLQEKYSKAKELRTSIDSLEKQIALKLNGQEWTNIQASASGISEPVDTVSNIQQEIRMLCGSTSVDLFWGQQDGQILSYKAQYASPENLAELISKTREQIQEYADKLDNLTDIPAEYQNIANPDAFYGKLKKAVEDCDTLLEELHEELRSNQLPPDSKSAEEYGEDYLLLKEKFEEEKAQYHHWKHIQEVFLHLKEQEMGNPTQEIQAHFQEYLSLLSDGSIRLNTMDEKLHSSLVSGRSRLTGSILSEGTKDTVALAFRLAMLEHLYPDGGAVAIFDDPFTDMDPRRTTQACRLLQHFAQRNQVLFITCDEKYTNLLSGNVITVSPR